MVMHNYNKEEMDMLTMKAERLRRGWRQVELAFRANMSPSDVSRYETGRMEPYPAHRERLARALGITPDHLTRKVRAGSGGHTRYGRVRTDGWERGPAKPVTD